MNDPDMARSPFRGTPEVVLPVVSVVVAFRSSENCILDCLQSILAMDYPRARLDVIAVDDGRDDVLAEAIRRRFPTVRLIRPREQMGCDGAKQAGIDAATGDVVALTDADCTVSAHWVRAIVKNLADGAGAVTGPVRHPRAFLRELIAVSDFRDFQSDQHRWTDIFPGCNFGVWRRDIEGIPYNRSGEIRGGSDRLFSWLLHKNGWRILHDPGAIVHHSPAVNIRSLLVRRLMYGRTAIGMRVIDPTLPGGRIIGLGPLAAPAYLCFKAVKDTRSLFHMCRRGLVSPWHAPLLLPALILFRVLDSLAMIRRTGTNVGAGPRVPMQ